MTQMRAFLILLLTATFLCADPLQPPDTQAPLLFVRVQGPEGMSVAFLEGSGGRVFDAPVTVGLRPYFRYRLRLSGLPGHPNAALFPSLEVRGTLRLPPRLRAADFPIPIIINDSDIEQALNGILVTKVFLLEDADKTNVGPALEGQPVQIEIAPNEDPLAVAKSLGRPVIIMRIGSRQPDATERARLTPGLILYPGQTSLPPLTQAQKQCMLPSFVPLRSLQFPAEECLRDGGDQGQALYLDADGAVRGIDPSDSVAEYKDSRGQRRLAPTNTICVFVPRFIVVNHLTLSAAVEGTRQPGAYLGQQQQDIVALRQQSRKARQLDDTVTLRARQHIGANVTVTPQIRLEDLQVLQGIQLDLGLAEVLGTDKAVKLRDVDRLQLTRQIELAIRLSKLTETRQVDTTAYGPRAVGRIEGAGQVTGSLQLREYSYFCSVEQPEVPERPLYLLKWASADSARVGDVITFYIRYSNLGGKPIRDIAISDSLSGRLEYIPGSAVSDREAVFVTQENEAGSLILRWEIRDPLPPGQRGVVSFQTRVR